MKLKSLVLVVFLIFMLIGLSVIMHLDSYNYIGDPEVFFGVSFGQETVEEAKLLIDEVKAYSNFFLINNWNVITNQTALTQIAEYAVEADLQFVVFFVTVHPWHIDWILDAQQNWEEHFLGAYLYDEPGGRQIDTGSWFSEAGADCHPEYAQKYAEILANASTYGDVTELFTTSLSSFFMEDLKDLGVKVFTSDYTLYWFDYLAGYDCVLVQLGWDHDLSKHISLCRGAANVQDKEWGAIVTWVTKEPPYLANGEEILEKMILAYEAGAKYIVLFNYPTYPQDNPYGILKEEHFEAMQNFWIHIHENPQDHGKIKAKTAFVLPQDYAWGLRGEEDNIWGVWPADQKAPIIWENLNSVIDEYGLELDIIHDNEAFNYQEKYSKIYYWNQTTT